MGEAAHHEVLYIKVTRSTRSGGAKDHESVSGYSRKNTVSYDKGVDWGSGQKNRGDMLIEMDSPSKSFGELH